VLTKVGGVIVSLHLKREVLRLSILGGYIASLGIYIIFPQAPAICAVCPLIPLVAFTILAIVSPPEPKALEAQTY
jgi:hypothetical protein